MAEACLYFVFISVSTNFYFSSHFAYILHKKKDNYLLFDVYFCNQFNLKVLLCELAILSWQSWWVLFWFLGVSQKTSISFETENKLWHTFWAKNLTKM